ncbi:20886_t:CDS:2 [Rhizophagus irregularis]|nr:20886_t:CDS:2 [Rhizophagus irregularis]
MYGTPNSLPRDDSVHSVKLGKVQNKLYRILLSFSRHGVSQYWASIPILKLKTFK